PQHRPLPPVILAILIATAAACGGTINVANHPPPPPPPTEGHITWQRAETAAAMPHEPPAPGSYRIHLIDVGTGLSILVQGADFAMLYDAGTNDSDERPSRVIAYLAAAIGQSGPDDLCSYPPGSASSSHKAIAIDHVVLSHPHYDHASA